MLTSSLISYILEEVGTGWTRTRAREILNRVQNEVLAGNNQLMRIKPDPYFVTTDSVYAINANAATGNLYDIRTVNDIYQLQSNDFINLLNPIINNTTRSLRKEKTRDGVTIHQVFDLVESKRSALAEESDGTYDCVVNIWPENNPGTTTTTYRAECYRWPVPITAESIALEVPDDWHDTLLFYGVLSRTERREYGSPTGPATQEYEILKKKFFSRFLYSRTVGKESHVFPAIC